MADLMHKAEIQAMVAQAYRAVTAPTGAGAVHYTPAQLDQVPAGAADWSLGVGNPMAHAPVQRGDAVLDVGCGAGIDAILAARTVGHQRSRDRRGRQDRRRDRRRRPQRHLRLTGSMMARDRRARREG